MTRWWQLLRRDLRVLEQSTDFRRELVDNRIQTIKYVAFVQREYMKKVCIPIVQKLPLREWCVCVMFSCDGVVRHAIQASDLANYLTEFEPVEMPDVSDEWDDVS